MLSILMLLLAAAGPTPDGSRSGTIFATVGHSEWCPAGNVQIDLRTGRYRYTARASRRVCHARTLERPVRPGQLGARDLAAVRSAFERARADGLVNPACERGPGSRPFVVSNGGTPVLVVTDGARTQSAPDELGCWSEAANALHGALERIFPEPRG